MQVNFTSNLAPSARSGLVSVKLPLVAAPPLPPLLPPPALPAAPALLPPALAPPLALPALAPPLLLPPPPTLVLPPPPTDGEPPAGAPALAWPAVALFEPALAGAPALPPGAGLSELQLARRMGKPASKASVGKQRTSMIDNLWLRLTYGIARANHGH